jgi:hypothetical protein
MSAFNPIETGSKLQSILTLIKAADSEAALRQIADLVAELRLMGEASAGQDAGTAGQGESTQGESTGAGAEPEPWRLIAAQLKAAELQIQETHLSSAEDSLAKAIYVALHGGSQAAAAQLNV